MKINWGDIEKSIDTLTKVDGGFSPAHRGIVTLSDGRRAFVKVGINDPTKEWAKKEVEVYRFLQRHTYPFIPRLLAYNNDETSFALEALAPEDGWNWSDEWTEERLTQTLEAMDVLAARVTRAIRSPFCSIDSRVVRCGTELWERDRFCGA